MPNSGETLRKQLQDENARNVSGSCENGTFTDAQTVCRDLLPHSEETQGEGIEPAESLWTSFADGRVKLRIDNSCPQTPITVHQMFKESLEKYGSLNALASKRNGKWEKITFSEYYCLSRKVAKSFLKLGLERFHSVAILGFNSPEWFISAVGAVFAGGIVTGIYTTNSPEACYYMVHDSKTDIMVVENQKQLDKIMQIWNRLPHLKAVVLYKDSIAERHPNLYTMEEFLELGGDVSDSTLDDIINSQKPNQCCVLIYTSGTTGKPKGAMLSHDNITWTSAHCSRAGGMQPAEVQQESIVSYLPLSHVAAQMYDLWTGIKWGEQVYFAEPDALKGSLINTLKEVQPTSHMGVPRVWEKIMEKLQDASAQSGFMKKKMLSWAMSLSLERHLMGSNSGLQQLWTRLADYLVLAKIRNALGLSSCQKHFCGAAPLNRETLDFFLGLNITLYEAYGMSETTGPHCLSGPHIYRQHSCGKPPPGCRVKLVDKDAEGNGEICFWGRTVFMGYLNMEDRTKETFDEEGWLHSGDLGKLDKDGFLYVTGRIKDLIITAGGENVPPIPIEDAVKKELPIVSNAMVIGDKKKFLSMFLTLKSVLDPDTSDPTDILTEQAKDFCQRSGSKATRVSEIVAMRDPAIYRAIQEGIDRVNSTATNRVHCIHKWIVLPRDFSIAGGELGPTMKLKRLAVLEKYRNEVDSFYKE
ncbi:long-chain-fatty-acid--CoA ligase ACSBG1 isoform X2 [Catharus ustulatus]|uniref:long-chain-fatty-acid--CoA ligase ACSBG1 isoform X2 n=1 Tax=Catharus ustulatus TaxID=91951 RepID=UPI001407B99D|nr:long-chain-fatty-acid--CoA ligase ACSBG1 isoform X2 [Catharus ustulatus]